VSGVRELASFLQHESRWVVQKVDGSVSLDRFAANPSLALSISNSFFSSVVLGTACREGGAFWAFWKIVCVSQGGQYGQANTFPAIKPSAKIRLTIK
jgi:hypothetical protein